MTESAYRLKSMFRVGSDGVCAIRFRHGTPLQTGIRRHHGLTLSLAAVLRPYRSAVMVTVFAVVTGFVLMLNVAVVVPAGMTTDDGTLATVVSELASVTVVSAAGAVVRVIRPIALSPPATVLGTM